MKHLGFFIRQAIASVGQNRQRSAFVLFCIAVGVAAVVSLRSLGLMIGDGLTRDLEADNRADIVVNVPIVDERISQREYDETLVVEGGEFSGTTFSEEGVEAIRGWAVENGSELQVALRHLQPMPIYRELSGAAETETILAFFVEPETYPFRGELEFVAPPGGRLADLLGEPGGIALSARLAEALRVEIGDRLRLRGPRPFEVRAILANGVEARMREMEAIILPWAMLSYEDAVGTFAPGPDTLYLRMPPGADVAAMGEALGEEFAGTRIVTTEDLRERNNKLAERLTRLITTMGLVSLLIGGIGIVNTMLVVVGRRTLEIGVLKSIGLQGGQITWMFLLEALALGVIGSLLGIGLGIGLLAGLRGVAESVAAESLTFQIHPEALAMGLGTGILVTLVFGFLPTLAASRVRPNVVLQPDRIIPVTSGATRSLAVMVLLTGVVGLMVGQILGRMGMGIALAYAAVAGLGLLTWIFRGVVLLSGKLPTFGSTYLKLTQRAAQTHPGRTASTLLALVVGMFALSSILLMTGTLLNLINDVMEERLGGDVIVVPDSPAARERAASLLEDIDGVESVKHQLVWRAEVVAIDGDRDVAALEERAFGIGREEEEGESGAEADRDEGAEEDDDKEEDRFDRTRFVLKDFFGQFTVSRAGDESLEYEIAEGNDVEPGNGLWVVLRPNDATEWLGLGVGSTLTLAYPGGGERTVQVAGIIDVPENDNFNVDVGEETRAVGAADVIPTGAVPGPTPFIVAVEDDRTSEVIRRLSKEPGLFAIPVTLVNQMLTGLFEKLTALPLVVAILALFAAGVIMANTVSLAVLERRRQIGIMKAIGLHSGQVLRLLLLENALVGLMGGLIGAGIGASIILYMGVLSESPGSFPFATLFGLVALAVAISIVATLVTAWGASREKPLVVLRYE